MIVTWLLIEIIIIIMIYSIYSQNSLLHFFKIIYNLYDKLLA